MKKLFFTVTTDLNSDQRMQRICGSLAQNGFDVTLIGRELNDSDPIKSFPFKTTRLKCFFEKGKFFYLEFNLRLIFHFLFKKFDTLCSCDADTLIAGVFTKWIKRKTLVFDGHEYYSEMTMLTDRKLEKRLWQIVENTFLPFIDYGYTVGDKLGEIYTNRFHKPFKVIRNVPKFRTNLSKNVQGKRLLYQGALNEGRGLDEIIPCMKSFDGELVICGDGPHKDYLVNLVNELQLNDKITFLGWLSPEELRKQTPDAWIGLNLMIGSGFSYYYSLTNKFFDYIQAEVPQLSINFPEYVNINKQYDIAYIVSDLKENTLISALKELSKPDIYHHLQENTKKARLALIWEKEEKELISLYQSI